MIEFILKYKFIILFYGIIILLLVLNRKKIETQAKAIFLYRMKWGLRWMDKYSQKFREWVILLGYIGVGAGFVGLVFISINLMGTLINFFLKPKTAAGVALVLPGLEVPGIGILPFWYWIIALFVLVVVHEFAHGIVARAHNIEVKNTGLFLLGPIPGAFVEPDEKDLRKKNDIIQYSILAAGPFSNVLLAILAFVLLGFVFLPIQQTMIIQEGFVFDSYMEGDFPAEVIPIGAVIIGINGVNTENFQQFANELNYYRPSEKITIATKEKDYNILLAENPDDNKKPFLGIKNIRNKVEIKEKFDHGLGKAAFYTLEWFNGMNNNGKGFLFWLYLLSLGIGLINLLPLPITDGGRMAQVFFQKLKGKEKGEKIYRKTGLFFLLLLLVNLLYPLIAKLF